MGDRIRAHVYISGRVQGVFYRATCRDHAAALGLGGWVRNLSDGRVEAVFEGAENLVDRLIGWCHKGPPAAAVSAVDVRWETPAGEQGFSVS